MGFAPLSSTYMFQLPMQPEENLISTNHHSNPRPRKGGYTGSLTFQEFVHQMSKSFSFNPQFSAFRPVYDRPKELYL